MSINALTAIGLSPNTGEYGHEAMRAAPAAETDIDAESTSQPPGLLPLDELGWLTLTAKGDRRSVVTDDTAGMFAAHGDVSPPRTIPVSLQPVTPTGSLPAPVQLEPHGVNDLDVRYAVAFVEWR